jgi:hypothetical protein
MRLSGISFPINENVEKLIPHLKKQVFDYLDERANQGLPLPRGFYWNTLHDLDRQAQAAVAPTPEERMAEKDNDLNKAVKWILRADPRFAKDQKKGKPLDKSKAPFSKNIAAWWLHPDFGRGEIDLPEDAEVVADRLKIFNAAKQQGLNVDINTISSWDQMLDLLDPYLGEKDFDKYEHLGLTLIYTSGPWKMYQVDEWDPEENTKEGEEVEHKALSGSGWCVRFKHHFTKTYKPPYYIVVKGARRFALIHIPSMQYKNVKNRRFGDYSGEERPEELQLAQDFFDRLVTSDETWLAKIFLQPKYINTSDRFDAGDFTHVIKKYAPQEIKILNTPEMLKKATEDQKLFNLYLGKMLHLGVDKQHADKLFGVGFKIHSAKLEENPINFPSILPFVKLAIANGHDPSILDNQVLQINTPVALFSWAIATKRDGWQEAEPIIATNQRLSKKYEKRFGKHLDDKIKVPQKAMEAVTLAVGRGAELPEYEDLILTDLNAAILYATEITGPWPELEELLNERGTQEQKLKYTQHVMYGEEF